MPSTAGAETNPFAQSTLDNVQTVELPLSTNEYEERKTDAKMPISNTFTNLDESKDPTEETQPSTVLPYKSIDSKEYHGVIAKQQESKPHTNPY